MNRWVLIDFECLPLRSVGRLDIPLDASPKFQEQCLRVKQAIDEHGRHNTYYLHQATCTYHLTNQADLGSLSFRFEGTILTDASDVRAESCDLEVTLAAETCSWLTEPMVDWFATTVTHSVKCEFDRYIEAGDLEKTKQRIEELEASSDASGGYVGMYL